MFLLSNVAFLQILSALNMVSPATLFLDWGSILNRFQVRSAAASPDLHHALQKLKGIFFNEFRVFWLRSGDSSPTSASWASSDGHLS
jgi:hypothetical protein